MIVDDISAVLSELRQQAESMMTSECRIKRPTGTTVDPITGADVPTFAPVYPIGAEDGRCKVQTAINEIRTPEVGSGTVQIQQLTVHVPVDSGPYQIGDVVEILSGGTVTRTLRVTASEDKTWLTSRRLPVSEVTSGH